MPVKTKSKNKTCKACKKSKDSNINCCTILEEVVKQKRKKRTNKTKIKNDSNINYVDESGKQIQYENNNQSLNETFNSRKMNSGYIQQPFKGNNTVLSNVTEKSIIDNVIEKIQKLNTSINNQSSISQVPSTPIQPRQRQQLSTIAGTPTTLNFDLNSDVRPISLTPLEAGTLAMNRVQNFALSSLTTTLKQNEDINKIFYGYDDMEQAEIKRASQETKQKHEMDISSGSNIQGQSMKIKSYFKRYYKGRLSKDEAAVLGWQYYKLLP